MFIWVITRSYALAAGGVTHLPNEYYFKSEAAARAYMKRYDYEPQYYRPTPLSLPE